MEMTRYSLGQLYEDTGITEAGVQQRMVDFGVDTFWVAPSGGHFPQPSTPEVGEMISNEDVAYWIAVLRGGLAGCGVPYSRSHIRLEGLDDPERWAKTWRAYQRKHGRPPAEPRGAVPARDRLDE